MTRFSGLFDRLPRHAAAMHLLRTRAAVHRCGELWVFAYGSLLWQPCYRPTETLTATLRGYQRSLCVWSVEARGTPAAPGLGLGLRVRAGGRCEGAVHQVSPAHWEDALAALWTREMWTAIYQPRLLPVRTAHGVKRALAFVVDEGHPQYAGDLAPEAKIALVSAAHGRFGSCADYVRETHASLARAGVRDAELAGIVAGLPAGPT